MDFFKVKDIKALLGGHGTDAEGRRKSIMKMVETAGEMFLSQWERMGLNTHEEALSQRGAGEWVTYEGKEEGLSGWTEGQP